MFPRRRFLGLTVVGLGVLPGCSFFGEEPDTQTGSPLSDPVELNEISVMSASTTATTVEVRVVDDGVTVYETTVDLEGRDPDSQEMPTEELTGGWPTDPMELDVQARITDADDPEDDDLEEGDEWWGLSEAETEASAVNVDIVVFDGLSVVFEEVEG